MGINKTYYTFSTEDCFTCPKIIKTTEEEILKKVIDNDNYHCHYFSEPELAKKALEDFLSDRLFYSSHGNLENKQLTKHLLNKTKKATVEQLLEGIGPDDYVK